MAGRTDYYAVLGVGKSASQDEIKRAYRKLARKHHPDVNPGDGASEDRFKEISEAYHVLGDEERRKQYDRVGPEAFAQEFDMSDFAERFRTVFRAGGGGGGRGDLGFFEELFGGAGGFGAGGGFGRTQSRPRARRGADVRVEVQLGLEEALAGAQRTVSYRDASGGAKSSKVKIPAGMREGQQIRVRGKGEPGAGGGPPGDLYLNVRIAPHPVFEIAGSDLKVRVPITPYEAVLGATVEVPTLDGTSRIKIPGGTRNGQLFKLRGRGGPGADGGKGDLLARVEIVMPESIDEPTRELLERWRRENPYDPR